MSKNLMSLTLRMGANISDFQTNMRKAMRTMEKMGNQMKNTGKNLSTWITLPVLALGGASVKLASDFEESVNKVDVAFKQSGDTVKEWAKTALNSFGIAEGTALDMAALFGDMGTSMGLTTSAAAQMSTSLVGLAGDMASFKNINIDEAMTALNGIFTGETESLKRVGVVMTEANLKVFALSQGITKNISTMTQAEKVNLRYAYVMQQTSNAHGDFANTGGGAANQMRVFQESLKELGQEFGKHILPAFISITKKLNGLIGYFKNLTPGAQKTIIVFAALAAAIGPLLVGVGMLTTALAGMGAVWAFITSPITLVIAGLAALAAAFVYVYDNWDAFKESFVRGWQWLKNAVIDTLKGLLKAMAVVWQQIFKLFGVDLYAQIDKLDGFKVDLQPAKTEFKSFGASVKSVTKDVLGGLGLMQTEVAAVQSGVEQTTQAVKRFGTAAAKAMGSLRMTSVGTQNTTIGLNASEKKTPEGFGNMRDREGTPLSALDAIIDKAAKARELFASIADLVGTALTSAFDAALISGENFWKVLGKALLDIVKKLIAAAVAAFVLASIMTAVSGGVSGALLAFDLKGEGFKDLFTGLFGKMGGIPGMAKGGIVPAGFPNDTYPAMLTSNEIVVPGPHALPAMAGGSDVRVRGSVVLKGQDLLIAIDNADRRRGRVRGK